MLWRLAADLVMVLHLVTIAFGVIGSFLVWRWRRLLWPHLGALALIGLVNVAGAGCPYTTWEKALMERGGEQPFPGGFNEHYLVEPIHPEGITPTIDVVIYLIVIVPNAVGYAGLLVKRRREAGGLSAQASGSGGGPGGESSRGVDTSSRAKATRTSSD